MKCPIDISSGKNDHTVLLGSDLRRKQGRKGHCAAWLDHEPVSLPRETDGLGSLGVSDRQGLCPPFAQYGERNRRYARRLQRIAERIGRIGFDGYDLAELE